MQEPERLLAKGATDFERELLEAVKDERPSPELQLRMQQALGLPSGTAPPALAPKAPPVQPSAGAALGSGVSGVALKVILGTIVAGGLAYSVVRSTTVDGERSERAPAAKRERSTRAAPPPASLPAAPAAAPSAPAAELAGAAPPKVSPRAAPEQVRADETANDGPRAPTDSNTLRLEIELLDAVRSAALRGESNSVEQALGRYDARFPQGLLQPEAELLRRGARAMTATPPAPSRRADPEPASGR